MSAAQLYQQTLLELAQAAHGHGRLQAPDASTEVHNPLCGDRVIIDVNADADRVLVLGQEVRGCALCEASASWLGLNAAGNSFVDLEQAAIRLEGLMRGEPLELPAPFAELELFAPVSGYRSRHRCVLLPFEALQVALAQLRDR